jgi:hypothetical protein
VSINGCPIIPMAKTYLWITVGAVITLAVVLAFIRVALVPRGMSDDDLRSLYLTHKAEFELLKQMFLEDAAKSRREHFAVIRWDRGLAEREGIETARFEAYVELLEKLRIVSLHGDGKYVHFVVRSVGWAADGRRQGVAWREKPPSEGGKLGKSRFVHIENGWYIFDFQQ